jgi:RimJ/RimL family protein N-acetyltransferase
MGIKLLIETSRLFLRPLITDAILPFFEIFSNAETIRYASNEPLTFEQAAQQIQEYIEESKKHKFGYALWY